MRALFYCGATAGPPRRRWYNCDMTRVLACLPSILLIASLALPMAGPLLDHHFPERQPGHKHLGSSIFHRHSLDSDRSHHHGTGPADAGGGAPIAVNSYDGGPGVPIIGVAGEVSGISTVDFEPSSRFLLPGPPARTMIGRSTTPSHGPPRA